MNKQADSSVVNRVRASADAVQRNPSPRNVTELRDDLLTLYAGIRAGTVDLTMAKEASNAAGKIIKSAAVQLEYQNSRKEKPNIPFLK